MLNGSRLQLVTSYLKTPVRWESYVDSKAVTNNYDQCRIEYVCRQASFVWCVDIIGMASLIN